MTPSPIPAGSSVNRATRRRSAFGSAPDPPGGSAAPFVDHSPDGTQCWHTATGSDVNGFTSLISPRLDLSNAENPRVDYWRYFSTRTGIVVNNERLRVSVSNDDGVNWTVVEVIDNNDGITNYGGWYPGGFFVSDFVVPNDQVRVLFRVNDRDNADPIEAAIDDFRVIDVTCGCTSPFNVCSTAPNSVGAGATIGFSGSTSVAQDDFTLSVSGALPGGTGLFYYGPQTIQAPFGDGFRCVGSGSVGTFRLRPPVTANGSGDGSYSVDYASPPAGSGPGALVPGSTWTFQFWYRDPMGPGGSGFNLSDGLRASFCP